MQPIAHHVGRRWLAFWSAAAAANLMAAIVLATRPERAMPLLTIRSWADGWLHHGTNVYSGPFSDVDYPPHAIVALSPLALIPARWTPQLWAALNLVLALLAPVLAARLVAPRARKADVALFVLLFLCWSGTKTLLQVSLLAMVLGLAAAAWVERRPVLSGFALGLALMKPQISGPVMLWMLLARQWKGVAWSAATIAVGYATYCIHAQTGATTVIGQHIEVLKRYYLGEYAMTGESHLRPLLAGLFGPTQADVATGVVAVGLLLIVVGVGLWLGQQDRNPVLAAPALAGVWSLLTFYFLTYGFILLLPAAAFLFFESRSEKQLSTRALFWTMQAALMVDVPGAWRRLSVFLSVDLPGSLVAAHFDRLLMLVLFAALVFFSLKGPFKRREAVL